MTEKPKKAYAVYERGEEGERMTVVFATSPAEAKQIQSAMVDCAWIDLRVRRQSWADAYADADRIPVRAYLENGWWMLCTGARCGHLVDRETIGGMDDQDRPLCGECAADQGGAISERVLVRKAAKR